LIKLRQCVVATADIVLCGSECVVIMLELGEYNLQLVEIEACRLTTGEPPVKPWYTIKKMAFDRGVIKEGLIGKCNCMFFDIWDVVGLYQIELKNNPYKLYGIEQ